MTLVKLHIRENLSKSSFVIFAIIGILITAFVSSSISLSAPGVNSNSEYSQYATAWTLTNMLAALAAITLSMGSFRKHLSSGLVDMLKVHGKSLDKQVSEIIRADAIISIAMGLVLLVGMVINVIINRPSVTFLGFILAIIVYLIAILTSSLLMAVFNLILPPAPAALFGVFFVIVGAMREIFRLIVEMTGGVFGQVMTHILNIFPPIGVFGEIERDLFFGSFTNYRSLVHSLIYLWLLLGILYLVKKWRLGREK